MYEYLVVGSGPSALSFLSNIDSNDIAVIDVGFTPGGASQRPASFGQLSQQTSSILGENFEGLSDLSIDMPIVKIRAPKMRFMTKMSENLLPIESNNFKPVMSFAKGGLSNAWGAGVYQCQDEDLLDFPLTHEQLKPYYDLVAKQIGVSGANDDLTQFIGSVSAPFNEPLPLSDCAQTLLARYQKNAVSLNQKGLHIGHPRLAVLNKPYGGRPAYDHAGVECYWPNQGAIYNSAEALSHLIESGKVKYFSGYLALSYVSDNDHVELKARSIDTGEEQIFKAKNLILAAGALNTAKIVLTSNSDFSSRLPLLDNPVSMIPVFLPFMLKKRLRASFFPGAQLNLNYTVPGSELSVFGSFYQAQGVVLSEIIRSMPFSWKENIRLSSLAQQAFGLVQLLYSDRIQSENWLQLRPNGSLSCQYQKRQLGVLEPSLIRVLRKLGLYSWPSLCQYPDPGSSIHYGGMLPMAEKPVHRYQTDVTGRLHETHNVYVIDASVFSSMPRKNHSFTMMANAARIASLLNQRATTCKYSLRVSQAF